LPDGSLKVHPRDENRALRFTREQLLGLEFIAGVDGMIAVADILVHLRIGRDGDPVSGCKEVVPRVVIERRTVSENERLALNAVDGGELVARKGKIGAAPLQTHLTKSLANGDLCHLIKMDPESPVRARFTSRLIRLLKL